MTIHIQYNKTLALLLALAIAQPLAAQNKPVLSQTSPAGAGTVVPPATPVITVNSGRLFNYVRTYTPQVPVTNVTTLTTATPPATAMVSTTYLDGFSRAMQSVTRNFVSGKSLVQPVDSRPLPYSVSYPPYTTDSFGFRQDAFDEQYDYYLDRYLGEGGTGYGKTVNGSSATVRSVTTYVPGKSQVGLNRGTGNRMIANDTGQIRMWTAEVASPVSYGYYAANELRGEEVTDPAGGRTRTFTDKDGHIVYKAVLLEGTAEAVTQYVYDYLGQLRFVLPPAASQAIGATGTVTTTIMVLNNLCFQYQYDTRGRVKATRKPGEAGFTEVVYDRNDQAVMRRSPLEAALGKWEISFYDKQGRAIATSLLGSTQTQAYWQGQIDGTAATATLPNTNLLYYLATNAGTGVYPGTISGNDIMSYSFYDHYNYSALAPVFADVFTAAYFTESPPGAEASARSALTAGRLTGTRIRIVKDGGTGAELGDWIETVNYYDKKGRLIQQRIRNHTKNAGGTAGKEYICSYYDFKDRLLLNSHSHENKKTGHAATEHTSYSYDAITGRLTETGHKVNEDSWKTLNRYEYDALGQVSRKVLGNYGEVQDYSYNIRGQLSGINAVYAETGNKGFESRSFGVSLKYDYGFNAIRYDGKPAGIVWRGSGNSMMAYGYDYDLAGRLKKADYNKWEVNATYPSGAWSNSWSDYSVSNLNYDRNGNMTAMKQRGMGIPSGGSSVVPVDLDRLNYIYEVQSNRLARVEDTVTYDYGTGDFINGNINSTDYTYDVSGNLAQDLNKGIGSIAYTWFNKPQHITFADGNTISYTYDASGSKLQEKITAGGTVKTTDYIGNFVYRDDVLNYISTADGRTVYNPADGQYSEEFFVKDHLGNVRSVVDVQTAVTARYLASYEVASAHLEGLVFDKVSEIADDNPDSPDPGNMQSGLLNGGVAGKRVGTSLLLKVMAGDRVEMNVNSYYQGYNPGADTPVNAGTMLSSIVSTLTSGAGGLGGSESHNPQLVGAMFNSGNYTQFNSIVNSNTDAAKPKAYLNYILFNRQMQMVGSFSGAFQANGDGTWSEIGTTEPMEIPQNGYLAVYLTGASLHDVYFDQLLVRFTKGRLKEENHYYPHGLPMGNIGSTAMGFIPNRARHQGNLYIEDAGLNWMDFNFRQYDPQTGRFLGVDPLAANTDMLSPFAAMNNQPESVTDPLGLQGQQYNASYQLTNMIGSPINFGWIGEKEGNKNGLNQPSGNAPGGAAGWFSMLSIAMGNTAAANGAIAANKELKPGDVVTDEQGMSHTYLGKDEYGNNMYSMEGVNGQGYYNPKQDPFQGDLKQIETGNSYGSWFGSQGGNLWNHLIGPGMIASGAEIVPKALLKYVGLRGFVTPGATRFTSVASATLRATVPEWLPRLSWLPKATSLGGQLGRAIPLAGWFITLEQLQWEGVHYSIENAPENLKDGIMLGYSLGL